MFKETHIWSALLTAVTDTPACVGGTWVSGGDWLCKSWSFRLLPEVNWPIHPKWTEENSLKFCLVRSLHIYYDGGLRKTLERSLILMQIMLRFHFGVFALLWLSAFQITGQHQRNFGSDVNNNHRSHGNSSDRLLFACVWEAVLRGLCKSYWSVPMAAPFIDEAVGVR